MLTERLYALETCTQQAVYIYQVCIDSIMHIAYQKPLAVAHIIIYLIRSISIIRQIIDPKKIIYSIGLLTMHINASHVLKTSPYIIQL